MLDNTKTDYKFDEDFDALFKESIKEEKDLKKRILSGTVLSIDDKHVTIDVGLKSEGRIPLSEFTSKDAGKLEVKVGDKVDTFMEMYENGKGQIVLSREKAKREEMWDVLYDRFKAGESVKGFVVKRIKGGFIVDVQGVSAFLPGSQLDSRPMKNIHGLVGTEQELKILKMERLQYNDNMVVSRKEAMGSGTSVAGFEQEIEEGKIVKGIVKNITGYGVFADLGQIDGLLHVTDISWSRINHPSEVLKLGQEIQVKVIKYDKENNKVSLGMKQLTADPWGTLAEKYTKNQVVDVKVINVTDYGAFVNVDEGVQGLIHVSELSWGSDKNEVLSSIKEGQELKAIVMDLDFTKRRMNLSLKRTQDSPWIVFASKHKEGDEIEGIIKEIKDKMFIVTLGDNVFGKLNFLDLSWNQDSLEKVKDCKIGDKIKTRILKISPDTENVILGVKHLIEDPYLLFSKEHKVGNVLTGTVKEIDKAGMFMDLGGGVDGFVKRNQMFADGEKDTIYNEGDKVEAVIIAFEKNDRIVRLSVRAHGDMLQKESMYDGENKTTLGDIVGDILKKDTDKE